MVWDGGRWTPIPSETLPAVPSTYLFILLIPNYQTTMKLYQIEHINKPNTSPVMGLELHFVASVCPLSGELREPCRQPDEWDNVKRLTNQLFLAWDDKNSLEGTVYVGEFLPGTSEDAGELRRVKDALEDANSLCRSAMMIAERNGEANWETFTARLRESLERQHAVMHPRMNREL